MTDDTIEVPVWVKRGKMIVRRAALNGDDPDHTYNYLKARGIRPETYGIRPGSIDPAERYRINTSAAGEKK